MFMLTPPFALLAYSELYALTREQQFLNRAEKLHDWMKTHLALSEGGYAADVTRPAMLNQNPNMHLFEAMLSWWQITGSPRWEKEAHDLFHLFSEHFFHRERHCLTEFFASGWQADHAYSMRVDPGHHHEWTWLLYQYEKLAGVETEFWRDALQNFAATAGENPLTQAVMNEVYSDKTPYRAGSRLWCQTERVKADVVACITRRDAAALQRLENHVATMMRQYITGESGRVFCDEISDVGERLAHSSPASTLYHLYIACREVDSLLKAQAN